MKRRERERKKSGRKTLLKMDSFTTFKREERKKEKELYQRLRCGRQDWPLPWMLSSNLSSWRLLTPIGRSRRLSVWPSLFSSSFSSSSSNSFSFLYVLFASLFSPTGIFNRANKTRQRGQKTCCIRERKNEKLKIKKENNKNENPI
jgi:hypothetical protein